MRIFRTKEAKNKLEYKRIRGAQVVLKKHQMGEVIWGEEAPGTVSGTRQALGQGIYGLAPGNKTNESTRH